MAAIAGYLEKVYLKECKRLYRTKLIVIGPLCAGKTYLLDHMICTVCFVLFCFVLFCFVLFCFVLFCFVLFSFVNTPNTQVIHSKEKTI